jgi:hypothetical protein
LSSSKLDSAFSFIRKNGFKSFLHYVKARYITHTLDEGLVFGLCSKPHKPKIIASLTSYPGRIATVHIAIKSLLVQSLKPDMLILWLAKDQFPQREQDLPPLLLELQEYGLTIAWCNDLRSHKKYYFAMQLYPEDLLITFDDDLTYSEDTIEDLYASYLSHPTAVSCVRAHLIVLHTPDTVAPYTTWEFECSKPLDTPSMRLFSTSGAGTLYPPHCMHPEVFNQKNLGELAPDADDLWLKVMQLMKNTPCVLARPNRALQYIPGTQEEGLYTKNLFENGNDRCLTALLEEYNEFFGEGDTLIQRIQA